MKYLFLVVIYKSSLKNSETLNSLSENIPEWMRACSHLIIWNNGPLLVGTDEFEAFKLSSRLEGIQLEQDVENRPLRWIYNWVLSGNFNRCVLLDQDTRLGKDYFSALHENPDLDVLTPRILTRGHVCYPRLNKQPIDRDRLLNVEHLVSIGSGLALSANTVKLMTGRYGSVFDERFALYGVDISFFIRLQKLGADLKAGSYAALDHSLSEHEQESPELRRFRELEKLYTEILLRLHYKGASKAKVLRYLIRRLSTKRRSLLRFLPKIINCWHYGVHPRCHSKW